MPGQPASTCRDPSRPPPARYSACAATAVNFNRQMSRMEMFTNNPKKGGNNSSLPNHSRPNSGMSFLLSSGRGESRATSRVDDGMLSAVTSTTSVQGGGGSPAAAARTAAAATATTVGGSGQRQQRQEASRPNSTSPRRLEQGLPGRLGFALEPPPPTATAASGEHHPAPLALGATASRPSTSGVPYPETPPPLRGLERRGSLVNRNVVEEDPKEQIDPELMIGEIKVPIRWKYQILGFSHAGSPRIGPWQSPMFSYFSIKVAGSAGFGQSSCLKGRETRLAALGRVWYT